MHRLNHVQTVEAKRTHCVIHTTERLVTVSVFNSRGDELSFSICPQCKLMYYG
jgi:hypothetical protein